MNYVVAVNIIESQSSLDNIFFCFVIGNTLQTLSERQPNFCLAHTPWQYRQCCSFYKSQGHEQHKGFCSACAVFWPPGRNGQRCHYIPAVPSGNNISAFVTSTEFGRVEFLYCCKTAVIQITCKICNAEASCPKELAQLILVAKPISPWKSVFCLPFREVLLLVGTAIRADRRNAYFTKAFYTIHDCLTPPA